MVCRFSLCRHAVVVGPAHSILALGSSWDCGAVRTFHLASDVAGSHPGATASCAKDHESLVDSIGRAHSIRRAAYSRVDCKWRGEGRDRGEGVEGRSPLQHFRTNEAWECYAAPSAA